MAPYKLIIHNPDLIDIRIRDSAPNPQLNKEQEVSLNQAFYGYKILTMYNHAVYTKKLAILASTRIEHP